MKGIEAIIFDLGGVILDIDYKRTADAFISLGVNDFDQLYSQHAATSLFEDLETGKLKAGHFYSAIREHTGLQLTNEQITTAWDAMLGEFPPERMRFLEQLSDRYKLFLYSNTNEIHYNAFMRLFKEQIGERPFDSYFNKAYYSHTLGKRKPYEEGFAYIINDQQLDPATTLFIDDTISNIEGAQKLGLKTILLQPPTTIMDLGL